MIAAPCPSTRRLVILGAALVLAAAGSALRIAVRPLATGRLPL